MTASHVIRGLWKARVATGASFAMVSDSLNEQYQNHSILGTMVTRFPVACLGGSVGYLNSSGSGWPVYQGEPTAAAFPNRQQRRPGETFGDGSSGHSVRTAYDLSSTTLPNVTDFSNPIPNFYLGVYDTGGPWEANWAKSHSGVGIVIARTTTNSPTTWAIRMANRGTNVSSDVMNLNQSAAVRVFTSPVTVQGTGGTSPVVMRIDSGVENESGKIGQILGAGFKLTTKTAGVFWGFIGKGGFTTKNHSSSSGFPIIAEPPTYTGRYSDEALDAEVLAYGYNVFGVWLGQNAPDDEWNGTTIGNFMVNYTAIINRIRASCARVGVLNPAFVLFSTYDTATPNTRFTLMANALRSFAIANSDCEFVDARGIVQDRFGAQSTHAAQNFPSAGGSDPVHLSNATHRASVVDDIYAVMNGPVVGVPGTINVQGPKTCIGIGVGICN